MAAWKRPLNIAHICPFYYPCTGGVAEVAGYISEELVKRGHSVTVFVSDRNINGEVLDNIESEEIIKGVRVKRFNSIVRIGYMNYCPSLIKELKKNDFDIIHCHSYRHPNIQLAISIGKSKSIPTILHEHGSFYEKGSIHPMKSIIYGLYDMTFGRKMLNNVTKVIALTKAGRCNYLDLGVESSKISVIANSSKMNQCSDHLVSEAIIKYELSRKKLILFIGLLDQRKNPVLLVNAMPYILQKIPEAFLLIIGPDMGKASEINGLIQRLRLDDHCKWLGPIYGEEKDAFISCSSVIVLPSNQEAFPLVLLEAMFYGKPVIATKTIGAMAIVVEGKTGYLFDINDLNGLVEAVVKLLSNEDAMADMGLQAKLESQKYGLERIMNQIEELYYDIL